MGENFFQKYSKKGKQTKSLKERRNVQNLCEEKFNIVLRSLKNK